MQIRSQRLIGEVQFPQPWRERGHVGGRVLPHALQHVHEVGGRVDALQQAGGDEALDDPHVLRTDLRPAEQPVASPHGDGPQGTLDVVRVDRHCGVVQEDLQRRAALAHIGQRPGQRVAWQQALLGELLIHPGEERLHLRFAVGEPMLLLGLPCEFGRADILLHPIQRADVAQRFARGLRFGALRFKECAPGMRPALRVGDARFARITRIGRVAVAQQDPPPAERIPGLAARARHGVR